uniref:Uncharacterized protein n=1 Tax=Panagrolaimus sp. ES5 TaxID=591445 RepID=A0AC34FJ06_9BILA
MIKSQFPIYDNDLIAEQGFIAFFDESESCPLEFLCKEKPFKILNENQILLVGSAYSFFQIRQQPCQWRFSAPDGYGFKIVIKNFNISAPTSLTIENTTDIIAK